MHRFPDVNAQFLSLSFLRFVVFLVALFVASLFITIPTTVSETPKPDVSQLYLPRVPVFSIKKSETRSSPNHTEPKISKEREDEWNEPYTVNLIEQEDPVFAEISSESCHVEDWNNVTLDEIPSVYSGWIQDGHLLPQNASLNSFRLLAGFVHQDNIAVTLDKEVPVNTSVFCHYFNCRRREMVRQMASFVFPESTVLCPRRAGASFISISEHLEEAAQWPVPLVKRLTPVHFLTVCVSIPSQGYTHSQLAEFLEYYKLHGAAFFHVYIRNSSNRDLLDDYVRTGEAEVVRLGEEVSERVQFNDCHHRNRYFSKWTALLELEDRLEVRKENETLVQFLEFAFVHFLQQIVPSSRSITDPNVNVLNLTSTFIIRPERIVSVVHDPITVVLGHQDSEVDYSVGVLRMSTRDPESNRKFNEQMKTNADSRVDWVFRIEDVGCEKKREARLLFGRNSTCEQG